MTDLAHPALVPNELCAHGEFQARAYQGGAWGRSTDAERPEGGLSGTLRRFKKNVKAAEHPRADGWIKATYPDAIEYSGMKESTEGGIMVGAFFGLMIGGGVAGGATYVLTIPDWFAYLVGVGLWIASLVFLSWMIMTPLRHVWRTPRDLPIIFDRRHRKVYRLLRDVQPGLKGLFKPWPIRAVTYEWDLLDAEHDAQVMGTGASVTRLHRLAFVVRKSPKDPIIIDHFEIGTAMAQGEEMIAPMWEHIRRFMEANGPHLPSPHEPLDGRSHQRISWWQACGEAGPFGAKYLWWWKNHPFMTLLIYHGLAGIGLVMTIYPIVMWQAWAASIFLLAAWIPLSINWGMGTGKWLLANTSFHVDWPQAVYDAIGRATRIGPGWGRG